MSKQFFLISAADLKRFNELKENIGQNRSENVELNADNIFNSKIDDNIKIRLYQDAVRRVAQKRKNAKEEPVPIKIIKEVETEPQAKINSLESNKNEENQDKDESIIESVEENDAINLDLFRPKVKKIISFLIDNGAKFNKKGDVQLIDKKIKTSQLIASATSLSDGRLNVNKNDAEPLINFLMKKEAPTTLISRKHASILFKSKMKKNKNNKIKLIPYKY